MFLETLEHRVLLSADMVIQWNRIAVDVLRADTTKPGPGWSSRALAMTSLAIFDSVNTIDRSYDEYLTQLNGYNARNTSVDAAIASSAYRTLLNLYPAQQAFLDQKLSESLAQVPNGSAENRGVQLGRTVADELLDERQHDGSDAIVPYTPNPAPGHWQPDEVNPNQLAWGPGWGEVKPFALRNGHQFRAPAPPALDSEAYASSYNEVKELGAKNSTTRTADQTEIGIFWGYDRSGMGTPPSEYCQAVEVVALQQHNTLVQNARLFALVNMAQADAGFAAWDSKFAYDLWRPITAIRRGGEDANPATEADATWEPLGAPGNATIPNFTPPFPAYVSGHATFGAATFKVLANFYHTDQMSFTLTSDELPGVSRSFTTFSQAAAENARSRIYLGIHWDFDDQFGQAMGRKIADYTTSRELTPRSGHGGHGGHVNDPTNSTNVVATIGSEGTRVVSLIEQRGDGDVMSVTSDELTLV
jgi:hypothetical protein